MRLPWANLATLLLAPCSLRSEALGRPPALLECAEPFTFRKPGDAGAAVATFLTPALAPFYGAAALADDVYHL
jgi:hypothetical protein